MSSSGDKGNFKTDLPQELLDAALDAVKKRESPKDVPVEVEVRPEDAAAPTSPDQPEAPAAASEKPTEVESLQMQLDASQSMARELAERIKGEHEKMVRAVADLENYKKRARKELEETQKFGNEKLLKDFVPVLDNIDRALEPSNSADVASLRKGVEMIRKLLEDTLGKHGVKAFTSKGKPFDPNFHEAMSQAETDEMPPNYVHSEVLRGFTLNDRLVRPGLVVVSKAKSKPTDAPSGDGQPGGGTNG